jgi:hypothetical protein
MSVDSDDEDELVLVESSLEEEVECWENERFYPFIGWSSNLLPTDRCTLLSVTIGYRSSSQLRKSK